MSARIPTPGPFRLREPDPKYMTLIEHLDELRHRLIVIVAVVAAGSVAGWFLAQRVVDLLDQPLVDAYHRTHPGKPFPLYVDTVYGGFTLYLKVAIAVGFMIALPVTLYQIWAFVAPAFGPRANRWGPIIISTALLLFACGVTTGYLVVPLAVKFFLNFDSAKLQILPFASQYVSFIALILVVFGISFELPLVLVSLTGLNIITSSWLWSKRAHFFFGIFAVSTLITPGADWISPLILGGILYGLYLSSIGISKLLGK